MERKELIKKYIEFFKSEGHKEIKNSSLIPENDPTTLFIGSGMETIIPFLLGQEHPKGKKIVNVQRCIRTGDIEEVGDTYHHTFFEMLGNWSLGDYWKKEAIEMTFEFVTQKLKIPLERLAATCFKGNEKIPKDEESFKAWNSLGIPPERIAFLDEKSNFWGPVGKTGPCGPNTEIFFWKNNDKKVPKVFDPKDEENWLEIGNDVLMELNKKNESTFEKLKQKNIDFGGGVERTLATINGLQDNYELEVWRPIIKKIENLSDKNYEDNKREMRIIADHIKAAIFIISDGVSPSNSEQGYVLRRLIRRAIVYGRKINLENFTLKLFEPVNKIYPEYNLKEKEIISVLKKEEEKFNKTLEKGMKMFDKISIKISHSPLNLSTSENYPSPSKNAKSKKFLDGKTAFLLFQSYGFPIEMTRELAKEKNLEVDEKGYLEALKKHQELSRTATAGKFKSGLADNSEKTTKLHTAAHLLLAALKKTLKNPEIIQKGSNINPERLRLDFSFDRKLTEEEKKEVESLVNEQISKETPVIREEMSLEEAKKSGAAGIFDDKYGEKVSVYTIGDFSKEICTGPHVKNTKEIGKFKIKKEQSSGSGVRRIKAVIG